MCDELRVGQGSKMTVTNTGEYLTAVKGREWASDLLRANVDSDDGPAQIGIIVKQAVKSDQVRSYVIEMKQVAIF